MEYYLTNELEHHGVKGQRWGVRRFQNKDGSLTAAGKKRHNKVSNTELTIPKGTIVKRVSTSKDDPTYDNKKYVSINQEDHSKWEDYLGNEYANYYNMATYNQTYATTKNLRVMSSVKQGELFTQMILEDPVISNIAVRDIMIANKTLNNQKPTDDAAENISRNIAAQTETGKIFTQKVLDMKYDAIVDTHGTNVSKDPLIVLNPDVNLERVAAPEYTEPTKEVLRRYGYKV